MRQNKSLATILVTVLISFATGYIIAGKVHTEKLHSYRAPQESPIDVDLQPVWTAWQLLEEKFTPATTSALVTKEDNVWGIIEGLAESYNDPYTIFLPPSESKNFAEEINGEFGGVGIEIGMQNGVLTVIAPLEGTPAKAAGLRSGDRILEVDDTSIQNMTIDEAIDIIRGEVGTVVTFTIARYGENEFRTISVTRDIIEIPTIDTELRDDGVFVLSLYNFGGNAEGEIRSALREFLASDSDKLLIDLRGNPGGYLGTAVDMASWFLPMGKTVLIEDYGENKKSFIYRSKGYDIVKDDWDIVVLVDEGSASASEIVAGALQEHNVATLIGEKTFGKGSVQELIDVTEDTSLKITVARWLTPNGNSLSETGLTPDYRVPLTIEDIEAGTDPQFDAAIEFLTTGSVTLPETENTTEEVEEASEIE
jgi:carboxyl-terminal processing protease